MEATKQDLKEKRSIIYKITNKINGKIYIGQTKRSYYERYQSFIVTKRHSNPLIKNSLLSKYSPLDFSIEILEHNIPDDKLSEREYYYVSYYNSMHPNGYNLTTGGEDYYKATDELKKTLREAQRKRRFKEYILMKDGKEYKFTSISEFAENNGLPRGALTAVINKQEKSCHGFHLPETDMRIFKRKGKIKYLIKDNVEYPIYNVKKFCRENNLSITSIFCLFRGTVIEHQGWHLPQKRQKKKKNREKYSKIILLKNDKEIILENESKIKEFRLNTKINLYSLLSGQRKIDRGYKILKAFLKNGDEIKI